MYAFVHPLLNKLINKVICIFWCRGWGSCSISKKWQHRVGDHFLPHKCKIFYWLALKYILGTSDRSFHHGLHDLIDPMLHLLSRRGYTRLHSSLMSFYQACMVWLPTACSTKFIGTRIREQVGGVVEHNEGESAWYWQTKFWYLHNIDTLVTMEAEKWKIFQ
jgi:hypothetical protein